MVYCSKCGTLNAEASLHCSNCGAPLWGTNPQDLHSYRHHHHRHEHHKGNSGVGLLIAGLIVIALGLTLLYGDLFLLWTYFWPVMLVVLGICLLIRGLMLSQQHNR